ncbi:MAG TPA: glycosyltransferase [Chitinophagaceae bacterium]|nr:glycosyltransferase [Chitinophagaceae bacterium]
MWDVFILANVIFIIVLGGGYAVLIAYYEKLFKRLAIFKPVTNVPEKKFSVIIPARNEEENIEKCILSILENDYPADMFEIIVADDFSTDATPAIVRKLQQQYPNVKLMQLAEHVISKLNSYKKKAIELCIEQAANEWIVTTDADCVVPKHWLAYYNACIQKTDAVFVAAPVMFTNNGSFISIFQCLDFISLQGITAASVSAGFHSMCNGANLAYSKASFKAVNGFKGVDNIASGDDMLLMHKILKQFPGRVGYLFTQEAIVLTAPMPDWKSFINQRIRWASKATSYQDKRIFWVLLLVYLFNLYLLVLFFVSFFKISFFFFWILLLLAKTLCEIDFMKPVAQFFSMKKLLWWFPVMQPFHVVYTVLSGWLGKFGKYQWKNRTVK